MNDIERQLWSTALDVHLEQELNAKRLVNDPATVMRYVGGLTDVEKSTILKPIYTQLKQTKELQRSQLDAQFAAQKLATKKRLDDEIAVLIILEGW